MLDESAGVLHAVGWSGKISLFFQQAAKYTLQHDRHEKRINIVSDFIFIHLTERSLPMNKADFIAQLALKLASSKTEAARSLEAVMAAMQDVFYQREALILPGFGTLGVKQRAARAGRNPLTGKTIHIPEALVPYIRVSAKMKALINQAASSKAAQKVSKKSKK